MGHNRDYAHIAVAAVMLGLWGTLIYSNIFYSPFHYDDFSNIVFNEDIHWSELSVDNVLKVFKIQDHLPLRPFGHTTFALNYYFGKLNPFGYHVVNIIIHIATALLLYLFLFKTFCIYYGKSASLKWMHLTAFLSSLLWMSNPVQTQAVTYIVQRMTSMAAMFYLLSLLFFVEGRLAGGGKRFFCWSLSIGSFFLSYTSKPIAITLPLIIVLYEICFFMRGSLIEVLKSRKIYVSLAFIVVLTVLTVIIFDLTSFIPSWGFAMKERIFTESRVIFHYIFLIIFPLPERMSLNYDYPLSRSLFIPFTTFVSITLFLCLAIYASIGLRKKPLFSFLMLWVLITFAIEAVPLNLEVIFEHRIYLPSMAFFPLIIVIACSFWEKWEESKKKIILLVLTSVILLFALNTYRRNEVWRDGYSVYADSVRKYPYSLEARLNLGSYYVNNGRPDEALVELSKAVELHPKRYDIYKYIWKAYFEKGLYDKAAGAMARGIAQGDMSPDAHMALGKALQMGGHYEDAEMVLRNAIELAKSPAQRNQLLRLIENINNENEGDINNENGS